MQKAKENSPQQAYYTVPTSKDNEIDRYWDGLAWTDKTKPTSNFKGFGIYKRHWLFFFKWPWWVLIIILFASNFVNNYLYKLHPHATLPVGIQWFMPLIELIGAAIPLYAFYVFLNNRLRFKQLSEITKLIIWGIIAGAIAIGLAYVMQKGLLHFIPKKYNIDFWWIAGPTEELAKIAIPFALWYFGLFRVPRQGLLLVLITATTFGIIEALQHSLDLSYAGGGGRVNASEVLHPLFSCFIAAVAWQTAWKKSNLLSVTAIVAFITASILHGLIDEGFGLKIFAIPAFSVIAAYLLLKLAARELVPPNMISKVSPWWRPYIKKNVSNDTKII